MMNSVKGAFTVRFLRNGDQVYITRNIVRIEGGVEVGASLFQAIDPNSGTLSVDWTVEKNQPIIKLKAESAKGYIATINSVLWAYDGNNISFGTSADANGWYTSTDGKFKRKSSGGFEMLKIVKNLASLSGDVVSNRQITYTVTYTSNALVDSITQSVDVQIQQAGTDSHSVYITTSRVELSKDAASTVLTAECVYGISAVTVGQNGYTMKWYQDGVEIAGKTAQSLIVYRNASDGSPYVEGGSVFTAKLFKNGNIVAQDGQRINDTSDEWQIRPEVAPGGYDYVSKSNNATFKLKVLRNGVVQSVSSSVFSWTIYNSLGIKTGSGTGEIVTVTPEHAKCTAANGNVYYGDVDFTISVEV